MKERENEPCWEQLHHLFTLTDGRLFWNHRPLENFKDERSFKSWNTRYAGKEAGYTHKREDGDRHTIYIGKTPFYRNRLVWIMHNRKPVPKGYMVDHRDTDPLNDIPDNLRLATCTQNNQNTKLKASNTSGFKGVTWFYRTNKWMAYITVSKKRIHLGYHDKLEDAVAAYNNAAEKYFGEYAQTNKGKSNGSAPQPILPMPSRSEIETSNVQSPCPRQPFRKSNGATSRVVQ